jgi:hypothetical protein
VYPARPPKTGLWQARFVLSLALLCCSVLAASPARAWIELGVLADVATVELQANGSAQIQHELMLQVRGGPLKQFTIEGVDPDAVPLEGATIVLAKSGRAAGVPLALFVERDEDRLNIEISHKPGLGSGSYLVALKYSTDLQARGLLSRSGEDAVLRWQGPRFQDGIDSLKTRFVVRRAEPPPRLWNPDSKAESGEGVQLLATAQGVFLAELHRESERDVLELTRPHAAKGEQVSWQIGVSQRALAAASETEPAAVAAPRSTSFSQRAGAATWWGFGAVLGACYALLLALKQRWLKAQRGAAEIAAGFLLPCPLGLRLALVTALLTAACGFAFWFENAVVAAALLTFVAVLSLQVARPERTRARGPGHWQVVDPSSALEAVALRGAGRWLEATTAPGASLLLLSSGGIVIVALRNIATAPYRAAALIAFALLLLPLFFVVGGARLCQSRLELERAALKPIGQRLTTRRIDHDVVARVPAESPGNDRASVDEYRLHLNVPRARSGFDSLELAVELQHGGWYAIPQAVFIARVREGSAAHEALPRGAEWSRGRHRDERIALLRPTLSSSGACLALAEELIQLLSEPSSANAPSKQRRRSAGRGDFMSKASAAAPPA